MRLCTLKAQGPEVLKDAEEDCLLKVEVDGAARKATSIKGDVNPYVKLQGPGVSCLAIQENAESLTLPLPIPPTTLEAASTECSPAVDIETPATPEPDHSADLEPQLHNILLPPNKAMEPPIHQPPKQIQAPTIVGGPLELLLGGESQCVMGQRGLISVYKYEGMMPIGEVHSCPPDLSKLQMQGSTIWEPEFDDLKACVCANQVWRPLLDKGVHTCPDL